MRVKLTYFKPDTGRYYAGAEYDSECDPWKIPAEVRMLRNKGALPGLKSGSNHWHILIETGIPHLIVDTNDETKYFTAELRQGLDE